MSSNETKKAVSVPRLIVAAGALALSSGAWAQEGKSSVNIGVGGVAGGDLNATVLMLEYERLVQQRLSVLGRYTNLKYKFDDGTYVEDGKGNGFGVGVRYYPAGGMKGFFLGGGVGYFKSTWDFIDDKGKTFETRGTGDSSAFQWGGEVGYRFSLGERVSLTPALNIGSWVGGDNSCKYTSPASRVGTSCSKESQLGFYAVGSVALGIAF
jgi:outer membrane autotransporter protein